MNLTPKEKAEQHRKMADDLDAVADAHKIYREAAEAIRKMADELDPPQPEPVWHSGDLARDRQGDLWQFDGSYWHLHGIERSTASLIRDFGPIHKVHVADPARQEVVVSLDGIDRRVVDVAYFEVGDDQVVSTAGKIAHRTAKAAREQLGEVQ